MMFIYINKYASYSKIDLVVWTRASMGVRIRISEIEARFLQVTINPLNSAAPSDYSSITIESLLQRATMKLSGDSHGRQIP
jgi:hypothetical protein